MSSKKLSGAECRKIRKQRDENQNILANRMSQWIKSKNPEPVDSEETEIVDEVSVEPDLGKGKTQSAEHKGSFEVRQDERLPDEQRINLNDPKSWPEMEDKVRCFLIENGPDQGKSCDFRLSISEGGRKFSEDWFKKTLPNNEKIDRLWLIYSDVNKSLFCFPCLLFARKSTVFSNQGFQDWKHLNPRIGEHENSEDHRKNYISWREMEKRLKKGKAIDDSLQNMILSEKEKWRYILTVIMDVVLFCAKNNLALRGDIEKFGHEKSGVFLSTMELLSKYNPKIAAHVSSISKGSTSYLSPKIQNEVISSLGSAVRREIISSVLKAKYYSISFDCTSDINRQEQMAEIVRYVEIKNGKCEVRESFLGFILTREKTGSGLAEVILAQIAKNGLDIMDCRGQAYDNGSNMAGKYRGVQARILQVNKYASFLPCSAHCLNLIGVHASSVTPEMTTFFGALQTIFNYFSGSTERWDALSHLEFTLKGHSDTRWSSKYNAVHSLYTQLPAVLKVLRSIAEGTSGKNFSADSVSSAKTICKLIKFEFVCLLTIWYHLLRSIDGVNKHLQTKNLSVEIASKHLKGLKEFLVDFRENQINSCLETARDLSIKLSIDPEFSEKRRRKVKLMFDENRQNDSNPLSADRNFTVGVYCVLDTLIQQFQWRFESLSQVAADFGFLTGFSLQNTGVIELKKSAADLALKYEQDLNSVELCLEIESFKHQAKSLLENLERADFLTLLNCYEEYGLAINYPNMGICLRLALTLPVTSASCERSFSKLKLIKNYLRSQMGQQRLSDLAILSIEYNIAKGLNFDNIIDQMSSEKSRRVQL